MPDPERGCSRRLPGLPLHVSHREHAHGLSRLLTADRIDVVDSTEEVRSFLDSLTVDDCFSAETWRRFPTLVQVEPREDILPVRADYEERGSWQIGINPLTSRYPLWYALPDVVAAKLLGKKGPKVIRALRLIPCGIADDLRPVSLAGEVTVDPQSQDFFRTVVEERKRLESLFLKVLANSTSYGIFAEMTRHELSAGQREQVIVFGFDGNPFTVDVGAPEKAGAFSFLPVAACITAAARLMLAMLEASVIELGGSYAMCDTDAMAIVATEQGGLVPCEGGEYRSGNGRNAVKALSWSEVERIRERFAQLNPYDPDLVGSSILKLETENIDSVSGEQGQLYCLSISAKRYALFNLSDDGQPLLRKWSEHGLGHLLNPTNPDDPDRAWIRQLWELLIRQALGLDAKEPAWLNEAAVSRITANSPEALRAFAAWNRERLYEEQIKPFNFMLSAQVAPFGHPVGIDARRFHLIAPYTPNPSEWLSQAWTDYYSGDSYSGATTGEPTSIRARIKSYRDVLTEYRLHPERKSSGSDGRCRRGTRGLLARRQVASATVTYIGKESNRLEDAQGGLVHELGDVLTEYADPYLTTWSELVVPVLRRIPLKDLAARTGLHRRSIERIRAGVQPRRENHRKLTATAVAVARAALKSTFGEIPRDDRACLAAYLERSQSPCATEPVSDYYPLL